jgi:lysozyme
MNEILAILIPLLKEFEGCKLKAYKCPAGIWTIGYGCTGSEVCEGLTWSQVNADQHLLQRAIEAISQVLDASPILHNEKPHRVAALASFAYNLGIGNYNKSSLKFRVNQGDWIAAQTEIKKWSKAGGVALAGLTKRRARESFLLG